VMTFNYGGTMVELTLLAPTPRRHPVKASAWESGDRRVPEATNSKGRIISTTVPEICFYLWSEQST
jgi:hypothetical protein